MKYTLTIFTVFIFCNAKSQSLEQQFTKASNKQEQMQIAMQIAQQNKDGDTRKSVAYAQKAYDLANLLGNQQVMAQSSWIGAEGYVLLKQMATAKAKFERCEAHAEKIGDYGLVSECYKQLIALAQQKNDYKEAARVGLFAADALKRKTGGSKVAAPTPAPATNNSGADNARLQQLQKENDRLQSENNQLRQKTGAVSSLEERLGGERAKVADAQRQIEKQKQERQDVEAQINAKESEINNMSAEQAKSKLLAERRQLVIANLKKQQKVDSLDQVKEIAIKDAELNKTRLIFGGGALSILMVAGILFTRYRQKKKSAKDLEIKNKLIEEERLRSDELLLNILPPAIADELKRDGKAQAKQYKEVTVLFTDFKNFTKISETLSPEQLVQELDYCFKAFDFIIGQYNIEKIKTIGDAYMCAAGLSVNGGSAGKMVKAALEMQEFLEDYKADRVARNLPYFEARIGIHTGPVVAGVVGSKKFAYDIWGDTVNTAARMEQNCEAGKVNISESTYWVVKYDFECLYRGKLPAKNKGEVEMYYAISKKR
jgi:adenylate cyclase